MIITTSHLNRFAAFTMGPFRDTYFTCVASDLGLTPGQRPTFFEVAPNVGNGLRFVHKHTDNNGTHHYQQEFGTLTLEVWND